MKFTSFLRTVLTSLFAFIVIVSITACAASAPQEPAAQQPASNAPESANSDEVVETAATQAPAPVLTDTPEPTPLPPTATPQPEPLTVTSQGFGQDGQFLGFGFIVENPNLEFAFDHLSYEINAYDANGTSIELAEYRMGSILPGQKLGVAGDIYLDEEIAIAKIEVTLLPGEAVAIQTYASDTIPLLVAEKVTYSPAVNQYGWDVVSGLVTNPLDMDISTTMVSFIAYNTAGEIIGGGSDSVYFLLPEGTAGATAELIATGEIARVEMYPAAYSIGDMFLMSKTPTDAQAPSVVKQGFGESDTGGVGYGLLIQNPNSNYLVIQNIQVTFYAEDGSVLGTGSDQITLFPNTTTGVAGSANLSLDADIARADFQIYPVIYKESGELPIITASNISIENSPAWQNVTGDVSNPTAADIERVIVYVIAYNEAGDIIGGGDYYLQLLPANGTATVETNLITAGLAATVEFYIPYKVD